jgi:hypothetical protein
MIITLGDAIKELVKDLKQKHQKKGEKNDGKSTIS